MNKLFWKHEDIKESISEFKTLYEQRPIRDNNGGMRFPHMLNAWYVVKTMKPKFIIESGVWKGLGTWFFEKASPDSQIISIDPNPGFRIYTSPKVQYFIEDFSQLEFNIDKENTLVFFDDHQNSIMRLKQCVEQGFKKVMFEDNYPYDQGDCYSIKKVLSQKKYVIDQGGNKTYHNNNPSDYEFLNQVVSGYQELPPVYKPEKTRWGVSWENYETPEPLIHASELSLCMNYIDEMKDYTWICYLELAL
jgi:hypothetical protein